MWVAICYPRDLVFLIMIGGDDAKHLDLGRADLERSDLS